MNIHFTITEQTEVMRTFEAAFMSGSTGSVVGYARVAHYDGRSPELCNIWLTETGQAFIDLPAFAETFFVYLKTQGYKELYMDSEDIDAGDQFGFSLESRDNSGWYPKYEFRRRID